MVHFGLLHTIRKYLDIKKMKDRMEEEKKINSGNPMILQKIEEQLTLMKNFRMAYELALCDSFLIKALEKYYTVHIKLMKNWGNYHNSIIY
jgi:hypothetical protein